MVLSFIYLFQGIKKIGVVAPMCIQVYVNYYAYLE